MVCFQALGYQPYTRKSGLAFHRSRGPMRQRTRKRRHARSNNHDGPENWPCIVFALALAGERSTSCHGQKQGQQRQVREGKYSVFSWCPFFVVLPSLSLKIKLLI
jgi:hypothetical protein